MQGIETRKQGSGNGMSTVRKLVGSALAAATLLLAGCRQDMHDQPKFFPQRGTTFYADGRSVRPQVANTVARNQGDRTSYFYTGLVGRKRGGRPSDSAQYRDHATRPGKIQHLLHALPLARGER